MKKTILSLLISSCYFLNSVGQTAPVDLYRAGTNVLTHIWSNGGLASNPSNTTTQGLPVYEGSEHFMFDYSTTGITNWTAQGQFTVSNWGSNLKNFSRHTHLVIAYTATSTATGNSLRFRLMDNSSIYGPYISVATNTAAYKIDTIPLSLFKGTSALDLSNIKEIGFQITGGVQSFTGVTYIDNLQVIDLVDVKEGMTDINPYGTYNFGSNHTVQTPVTFTIENHGAYAFSLTNTPKITLSGTNASDFIVNETTTTAPVNGGSSTTFTVTFSPSAAGSRNATIVISNTYGTYATGGYYEINLTGTGVAEPEINIKENNTSIASAGSFDFGSSDIGTTTSPITFTIENTGIADLILSGSPLLSVTGADAADFSVDETSVTSTVAMSGTTSFTVTFSPSATGPRSAVLTLTSNDSDEGTYVINLTGTGILLTEINHENINPDSYEAYPSPFSTEAVVKINHTSTVPVTILLTDAAGKLVYTSQNYRTNEEIMLGKEFPKGVYWVQVMYDHKVQIFRIVKID